MFKSTFNIFREMCAASVKTLLLYVMMFAFSNQQLRENNVFSSARCFLVFQGLCGTEIADNTVASVSFWNLSRHAVLPGSAHTLGCKVSRVTSAEEPWIKDAVWFPLETISHLYEQCQKYGEADSSASSDVPVQLLCSRLRGRLQHWRA